MNNESNRARIEQDSLKMTNRNKLFSFLESLFYFEFVDKTVMTAWKFNFYECLPKETCRWQPESQKHGY